MLFLLLSHRAAGWSRGAMFLLRQLLPLAPAGAGVAAGGERALGLAAGVADGLDLVGPLGHELHLPLARPPPAGGAAAVGDSDELS